MTTTPNSPQISTPEANAEGMVAPGQENILEEYIQEQQQQGEPELLAGKFRNQDELLKGYEELQRKLGQQDAPAEQQQSSEGYTQEQAVEVYGKEAVDSLQAKGINLADVMFKADAGEDISNTYDDLAAAFNVPRQVVENYVSKAQAGGSEDAGPAELSSQDEADIKEIVGGDQGFTELSEWAQANLDESELDAYNAAVDSNNKMAISWALKAMMARRAAPGAVIEPKLYGGGDVPQATRFESQQQVLDAMNKRNERGQRLYDVDSAYRKNIEKLLAASDVF